MTTRVKLEIAGGILALIVCGVLAGSWLGAREDSIRMKATIDAQNQVVAAEQKQSQALADAQSARDKATAQTVAALQSAASKQVTPAQIAAWIPQQIPAQQQPITITIPPATPQNPVPAAVASIPQADLPALRDEVTSCQVCAAKLSTAQSDLSSQGDRLTLAGEQLSAMTKERDAAVKASKGGGFWKRVESASKYLAIGAGVGAAAVCGTGHCK